MNASPKVSVVMPAYNSAAFLPDAIQSVLNQTYQDFELIVVDDGSTDETPDVMRQFQKDSRVRCLFKTHTDRCTAKNTGIEAARGVYLAFLDSDDVWMSHKLEKQIAWLDQHPDIAAVHGPVDMMNLSGRFLPEETARVRRLYEQAQKRGEDYPGLSVGTVLFTSALVVRKECLARVGYFDPKAVWREDLDLCLRIAKKDRIGFLGWNPVAKYRYRGQKGHTNPAVLRAYLYIFKKNRVLLERENLSGKYRAAYQHMLLYTADCYYLLNDLGNFRQAVLESVKFDFKSVFNFRLLRHFILSFLVK